MIDSHAHLIWESFDVDRDSMMSKAEEAGVKAFIHPCVHTRDLPQMQKLQKKYNNVFLSAGVHPCHAHEWTENCENDINNFEVKLFAIGETGLDYYHKDSPTDIQKRVFIKQCQIAKKLNLPLIVHCRDAFEDTLQILRQENIEMGVMHCYTGDAEYAHKFIELGFYISFSGCLTFKSAHKLREDAKKISLKNILIETDCPFLAPQKHRGKRNEPSFITETCQALADIHQKTFKEIAEITEKNTKTLFKIEP